MWPHAAAHADAGPTVSIRTLSGSWAQPGMPGWTPDADLQRGMPWTFAGLTAGSWELRGPLVSGTNAGLTEAQPPLAWYDSTSIVLGEGAAWRGFGAGIVTAEGIMRPPSGAKPRAVFTFANGSSGIDRNGIFLTRGNERTWLRAGAASDERGGIGDLGIAGTHVWGVSGGTRRGAHEFRIGFAQRGIGEQQRRSALAFQESGRGQNGEIGWGWTRERDRAALSLSRAWDERGSWNFSGGNGSERNGWSNASDFTFEHGTETLGAGVRLAWSESRAVRGRHWVRSFETWDRNAWSAVRVHAPSAGGTIELTLGGGYDASPARERERWQLAPALAWRYQDERTRLRLYGERTLTPVWTDLDPNIRQAPFMQDVWLGGFSAGASRGKSSFDMGLAAGRAGARATVLRYPVRDVALRVEGFAADVQPYEFMLAQASARHTWRVLSCDASGYLLARDRSVRQNRVDPGSGATGGLEAAFRLFSGDLAVRLRAEAAWVGERESDVRTIGFDDLVIPGYGTASAIASMQAGDATFLFRMDHLDGVRQWETWAEPSQLADRVLARGSGRQFRFELVWPLFN